MTKKTENRHQQYYFLSEYKSLNRFISDRRSFEMKQQASFSIGTLLCLSTL